MLALGSEIMENNIDENDLDWLIAEEINSCNGYSHSCYLKNLIEMQRRGEITEEEIVEKLKEYYGEEA